MFTVQNYQADNMRAALFNKTDFEFVDGQHFSFSYYFAWVAGIMYLAAGMYKVHAGRHLRNFCCCTPKRSRRRAKRNHPKMTSNCETPATRRHKSSSSTHPEKSSSIQPEKSSSVQPEKSSSIQPEKSSEILTEHVKGVKVLPEQSSEPQYQNTYL